MLGLLVLMIGINQPEVLIFTDPPNCPGCKRLEEESLPFVQAELKEYKVTRYHPIDSAAWKVDTIPTIIIAEPSPNGLVEQRRHVGFMDRFKLREFLRRR
jgi:hypothetical protein